MMETRRSPPTAMPETGAEVAAWIADLTMEDEALPMAAVVTGD